MVEPKQSASPCIKSVPFYACNLFKEPTSKDRVLQELFGKLWKHAHGKAYSGFVVYISHMVLSQNQGTPI